MGFVGACYNEPMSLKDEMKGYRERWAAVEAIVAQERAAATIDERWRQINQAYAIGFALGLVRPDPSEQEVYERWAKLKMILGN